MDSAGGTSVVAVASKAGGGKNVANRCPSTGPTAPPSSHACGRLAVPLEAGLTLQLSSEERSVYEELFSTLDVNGTQRIHGLQASLLLRAANLPTETLQQITELSGAKRIGHFGRQQFFCALKLIAGAQNGLRPSSEIFGTILPLPKLNLDLQSTSLLTNNNNVNTNHNEISQGASKPLESASRLNSQCFSKLSSITDNGPEGQSSSEFCKTWSAFRNPQSAGEWASPSQLFLQHLQSSDEQRHLTSGLTSADVNSEETDNTVDIDHEGVWTITPEQRAYYIKQFAGMQSDLERGKVQGQQAKDFFEKSRLPVAELSMIWQLADIDRDGQLALGEFCTAMHLVVLRIHGFELPVQLPPTLLPDIPPLIQTSPLSSTAQASSTLGKSAKSFYSHHENMQQKQCGNQSGNSDVPNEKGNVGCPATLSTWMTFSPSPASVCHTQQSRLHMLQDNAHSGSDHPEPTGNEVGTGPVSFDFSTSLVSQDPHILHPVARRASPDTPGGTNSGVLSSAPLFSLGAEESIAIPTKIASGIICSNGAEVGSKAENSGYVIMNNSSDHDIDSTAETSPSLGSLMSATKGSSFSASPTSLGMCAESSIFLGAAPSAANASTLRVGSSTTSKNLGGNESVTSKSCTIHASKKDLPPPPPPRPNLVLQLQSQNREGSHLQQQTFRGHHIRSSSLDLNPRLPACSNVESSSLYPDTSDNSKGYPLSAAPSGVLGHQTKGLFAPFVPPRSSPANNGLAHSLSGESSSSSARTYVAGTTPTAAASAGPLASEAISNILTGSAVTSSHVNVSNNAKIGTGGGAFHVYNSDIRRCGSSNEAVKHVVPESGGLVVVSKESYPLWDQKCCVADAGSAASTACGTSPPSSSSSAPNDSSYEDLSLDPTTDDGALLLLVDDDHTECGLDPGGSHQTPATLNAHPTHQPHHGRVAHRKQELSDAMMAQFITDVSNDREQLIRDINAHRERNAMLREWNRELHEELQGLAQERLSLQSQKQPTSTI